GNGGAGGAGTVNDGGAGGDLGNQSSAGGGGIISLTSSSLSIDDTGFVYANGGTSNGYGDGTSSAGNGGAGGVKPSADGGDGGTVGFAGSGGKGGFIQVSVTGAMTLSNATASNPDTGLDTIAVRGGGVLQNLARSGNGGSASLTGGSGGAGGFIDHNG